MRITRESLSAHEGGHTTLDQAAASVPGLGPTNPMGEATSSATFAPGLLVAA